MINKDHPWNSEGTFSPRNYKCGYCGKEVSSEKGWRHEPGRRDGEIRVCPGCKCPTFFDDTSGAQHPSSSLGIEIDGLPKEVAKLWDELRRASAQGSDTSVVLIGRKILMHVAVEKGAAPNQQFIEYVDWLDANHFAPPGSKEWVDTIRKLGNEANHEIKIMSRDNAQDVTNFLELLMKFVYEFPARVSKPVATATEKSPA